MSKRSCWKPRKIVAGLVGPLVLLAVLPVPASAHPRPGITERVSVASDGAQAVFASQLVPGSAGAGRGSATTPEVHLDDLAAAASWRAGDFPLPSPASGPGTVEPADAAESCSTPDDDRCETWAEVASPQINSLAYGRDAAYGAEMSPDGRHMFVAGTSSLPGYITADAQIASFDPSTGAVQWTTRPDSGLNLTDTIYDVTVSPDSSMVFIVGAAAPIPWFYNPWVNPPAEASDILTIALDAATGATLWLRAADPTGAAETAYAATVSSDGSTLVVAGAGVFQPNGPIALAYSTATGELLWTWTDPGPEQEGAYDVAIGHDAAYLVASDHNGSNYDTVAYALDLDDGTRLWTARFDGGKQETAWRAAVDDEHGRMYLLSVTEVQPQGTEYGLAAYDIDTGGELWRANVAGKLTEVVNIPTSLLVVPDRDPEQDRAVVIASGLMVNNRFGDYDFGTVAYDGATGAELWRAVYGSDRDERVWDMALSADRTTVYVTGRSGPPYFGGASGGTGTDLATVSYDTATGQRRWAARYVGSSDTEVGGDPEGVGVTPDGRWVVTGGRMGYSLDPSTAVNAFDFVAVGYDEFAS